MRSRHLQYLLAFSYWPQIQLRKPKNVYEIRSYALKPGTMIEWGNNWARAINFRQNNDEAFAGFFSQIGRLYNVHHIWCKMWTMKVGLCLDVSHLQVTRTWTRGRRLASALGGHPGGTSVWRTRCHWSGKCTVGSWCRLIFLRPNRLDRTFLVDLYCERYNFMRKYKACAKQLKQ